MSDTEVDMRDIQVKKGDETFIGIDFGNEISPFCPACGNNQVRAVIWLEDNMEISYWTDVECLICASRFKLSTPADGVDPRTIL